MDPRSLSAGQDSSSGLDSSNCETVSESNPSFEKIEAWKWTDVSECCLPVDDPYLPLPAGWTRPSSGHAKLIS